MEIKNYFNEITIKIFLYLLYENEYTEIPTILRTEKQNFIKDIFENELPQFFIIERNRKIFEETDYKNFLEDDYVGFDLLSKPLRIKLINRDTLTVLMDKYISDFKNRDLKLPEGNFYSFSKCILETY